MTTKDFIIRYLILKISVNSYKIGEPIPSENQLAKQFKCTRLTVRQAYNKLIEMNLLSSKKGVGYFVNQNLFQKTFTAYDFLLKQNLSFVNEKYDDKAYFCLYEIKNSNNENIGYVSFEYKSKLLDQEQYKQIDSLLVAYTLDSNLNWTEVKENYGKVQDKLISKQTNNQNFEHKILTTFIDPNDLYSLKICVYLNEHTFSFNRTISIL